MTLPIPLIQQQNLRRLAHKTLLDLATEEGINASGKEEFYGCIFGRDSAITILKILRANQNRHDQKLLDICRNALLNLTSLQGKEFNIESGEAPGKFVHEFRREKFEHLVNGPENWYLYPDNTMKNYDSIDSTTLALIAIFRYWEQSKDGEFLISVLPAVEAGLNWIISYGDLDKDYLLEYELHKDRKHGGLVVQSWTDSNESMRDKDGKFAKYPIAPVEAQGYAWLALRLWGRFYLETSPAFGQKLLSQAQGLKKAFNKKFLIKDQGLTFAAQALDGDKKQIKTITGNPLLLLWATDTQETIIESIIETQHIEELVKRTFQSDLFDKRGGIRTMSALSETFNPNQDSYHNGSFWPVLNGMAYEGLLNWNFKKQAKMLKDASLRPIQFFKSPIELYVLGENGTYLEYKNSAGQTACKFQAWSAAAMLDMLTQKPLFNQVAQMLFLL
jgi:glycogen debranching enzyme